MRLSRRGELGERIAQVGGGGAFGFREDAGYGSKLGAAMHLEPPEFDDGHGGEIHHGFAVAAQEDADRVAAV